MQILNLLHMLRNLADEPLREAASLGSFGSETFEVFKVPAFESVPDF